MIQDVNLAGPGFAQFPRSVLSGPVPSPDAQGDGVKKFVLRGKQYQLSRADVERATVNLQPRPGEKYLVEIGGVRFPPKQLLAESLKIRASTFTTIDANRILGRLGFEIVLFSTG